MAPFVLVLKEAGSEPLVQSFEDVIPEDYHNIQTHTVKMSLLEEAQQRQQLIADEIERSRRSPDLTTMVGPDVEMTPPADDVHQMLLVALEGGEKGRDAKNPTVTATAVSDQQPSVFLSPLSEAENSGLW